MTYKTRLIIHKLVCYFNKLFGYCLWKKGQEPVVGKVERSKYWETMCDILDGQFPKGKCKERGGALVMLAYIEMMFTGTKFDEEGRPIRKEPVVRRGE